MNRHNLSDGQSFGPIPQQQAMQAPFQWGAGGKRMTPDQIAREREIANAMLGVDYSPIQSPWQGLARVSENLLGVLGKRKADKAEQANMQYSDEILQSLMNPGGVPSASGAPGVASPAPGANLAQLSAILADPYVNPQVQALAKRQLDMADFENKQRLESQYGEQPEIVRLAQIAGDASRPAVERQAAEGRIKALNDPEIVIPGLPGGTYVGPRSGVGMAFGQVADDAPDELPADYFDKPQPGAPSVASAPAAPTALQPWQYDSFVKSMGKEAADQFLRRQGLTVGGK